MTDIPIIKTPTNPMSSVSMRVNQRCDIKQPSLQGYSCLLKKPSNLLIRLQRSERDLMTYKLIPITVEDKTPNMMMLSSIMLNHYL